MVILVLVLGLGFGIILYLVIGIWSNSAPRPRADVQGAKNGGHTTEGRQYDYLSMYVVVFIQFSD